VGVEDLPFVGASRVMAEKIPDADLVEIEDAAHSPQVENTARWLEAVWAHLARARG
jgi:pimeloyl-ACP methyl ester carboxylesterase